MPPTILQLRYGMLLKLQVEPGKINTSLYYIQELPLSGQRLFIEQSLPFFNNNSSTHFLHNDTETMI